MKLLVLGIICMLLIGVTAGATLKEEAVKKIAGKTFAEKKAAGKYTLAAKKFETRKGYARMKLNPTPEVKRP